jgi:transposase
VRAALVEASWSAVRNPGPLRAFYQRIRARRGHQVAITATARKLACLFWVLLWRQQDYAFGQPSLTAKKLRRLELMAGAPRWQDRQGIWIAHRLLRDAELDLARQAEQAYAQTIHDRQAAGAIKAGASATPGRASQRPSEGKAARQTTSP